MTSIPFLLLVGYVSFFCLTVAAKSKEPVSRRRNLRSPSQTRVYAGLRVGFDLPLCFFTVKATAARVSAKFPVSALMAVICILPAPTMSATPVLSSTVATV